MCQDFNIRWRDTRYIGVVIKGFTGEYEDACAVVGEEKVRPFTDDDVFGTHNSRMEAVRKGQPEVWERLRCRHAEVWQKIGHGAPVWFTSHAVAHLWNTHGPTRIFWHPRFFHNDGKRDQATVAQMFQDMTLGLLIHDEVAADAIVEMWPEAVFTWLDGLKIRTRFGGQGGRYERRAV